MMLKLNLGNLKIDIHAQKYIPKNLVTKEVNL